MNISFAWTTEAFLDGTKSVTRRFWKDVYARRFKEGQVHTAIDKDFRAGGKKVGHLLLTRDPYKEPLYLMTERHFRREGGTRYWPDKLAYIEAMGGGDKMPWVIEFVKVQVCRVCGCHDYDCRKCIERTGSPCHWVAPDLCSACTEVF